WRNLWGLIFIVAFLWSLQQAGFLQRDLINQGGWNLVSSFLIAATRPQLDPEFLQLALDACIQTLAYAVCGSFLSVTLGFIGGLLSSEVWWRSLGSNQSENRTPTTPWLFVRGCLAVPRAIHELIWGLFFVNIFGLDPLVGILAIAIPFGAITAKVFSEILDETRRQPLNSLLHSGVSPINAFAYSLIPQAFLNLLSYSFYRFECSLRSATVLGVIGAGGLGYQIRLSLQSLRYEQVWTLLVATILLTGTTDFLSGFLRRSFNAPTRLDLNSLKDKSLSAPGRFSQFGSQWGKVLVLMALALVVFCFWYVRADFSKFYSPRTWRLLTQIIEDSWPPDFSEFSQMFALASQTLAMSVLAITFAGIGGLLLSFPAANNFLLPGGIFVNAASAVSGWWGLVVLFVCRFLLLVARAIPEPIWALLLLFGLFPGILPGAIALGLHNFGILGRLMAEGIENLDDKPVRAIANAGATAPQTFLYGVLPRTLPRFVAYLLYRWEVCIRSTVIVGLVGAGGLGRLLAEQLSSFDYSGAIATLAVFIALTFAVDLISSAVRRSLSN
ncbi:MAG: ABC transporter permease subunit, partial [Cyanobacteriota bacterium]|nr:ABC transporter permease subunit [Cyanobacteriota bacterium]